MSAVNQPMPDVLKTKCINTPIGLIEIAISKERTNERPIETPDAKAHSLVGNEYKWVLWYVEFIHPSQKKIETQSEHPLLELAASLLIPYANGKAVEFSSLYPYMSEYGTDFQKKVWQALTTIPYGETWSYGQLAKAIGNANASRAVGAANGKNPLAIVVPCHRVIGSNGTLTGYAGGLDKKSFLLELESKQPSLKGFD
jgi:methylated-DNA-[protein]-cysteine S-methyltransferase